MFPDKWKKSNICTIHKNVGKQLIHNYRPVSLLSTANLLKSIRKNNFLEENKLLSTDQSGFQANGPCVNQLLFTVRNSVRNNVRNTVRNMPAMHTLLLNLVVFFFLFFVFLLICPRLLIKYGKKDLVLNLSQWVSLMHYLNLLKVFLKNKLQRVELNDETSKCLLVKAGVPQGYILNPLLFLV